MRPAREAVGDGIRIPVDIVQIDSARVGGVHENIAILLLAAK